MKKIRVGIFGGSGYGGAELLRILLLHPSVEIALVTANEHAGKAVGEVHRNLLGLCDLSFICVPAELDGLDDLDYLFLALPHGRRWRLAPLPRELRVIDLSVFPLSDPLCWSSTTGATHAMHAQGDFVYGLTETNRERIREARRISNPGCFATATLLGIAPLVAAGVLRGRVIVDAKTGSSGSGAKPAPNTHHPQRMNSFYAYKPFTHQHVPEIEQELSAVGDFTSDHVFMTHSLRSRAASSPRSTRGNENGDDRR